MKTFVPLFTITVELHTSLFQALVASTYSKSLNQYYHKIEIIMARNQPILNDESILEHNYSVQNRHV